jgi:hypothetical protein
MPRSSGPSIRSIARGPTARAGKDARYVHYRKEVLDFLYTRRARGGSGGMSRREKRFQRFSFA